LEPEKSQRGGHGKMRGPVSVSAWPRGGQGHRAQGSGEERGGVGRESCVFLKPGG